MGRSKFEADVHFPHSQVLRSTTDGAMIHDAITVDTVPLAVFSLATDPRAPANPAYNDHVYAATTAGVYL